MQRSGSMPFFWSRLASALLIGAAASGCAAGAGAGEDGSEDPGAAPSAPVLRPAQSAAPGDGATSNPAAGSPATSDAAANPAPAPAAGLPAAAPANEAAEAASETLPDPAFEAPEQGLPGEEDDDAGDDDEEGDDDQDDDDEEGDDDDDDSDDDDDDSDDDDDDVNVSPPPPADPGVETPAPVALSFTADIYPILLEECGRCHAGGGLPAFASANAASSYDVAFRERGEIVELIADGEMPEDTCRGAPGSNGCVSVADFNLIQQWVAAGAPE